MYLNLSDGTESISASSRNDAATNSSELGSVSPYPPLAWMRPSETPSLRNELLIRLTQIFFAYDVIVTGERPVDRPYVMAMVGGSAGLLGTPPGSIGVAALDCENDNDSDIVFVFSDSARGSVDLLAAAIAQEVAHSFGLEHTSNPRDLMYPRVSARDSLVFTDEPSPISDPKLCGRRVQNSHRRLLEVLGSASAGQPPPPVESDGANDRGGCSLAPAQREAGVSGRVALVVLLTVVCGWRRCRAVKRRGHVG